MKKIYSIIIAMILAAVSFAASAYSVTINIDHPERINLTTYTSGLTLPDPLTESFVVESSYASLTIYTTDSKYFIKSIVDQDGNPVKDSWGTYYIYVDSENDGKVFTINTGDKETEPKSKCYVTVDDPAKVKLALKDAQYSYINDAFEAAPAVNTVEFIEGLQSPLILKAATNEYVTRLCSVKIDGEEVAPGNNNIYSLDVIDGSNVEIVYNFPEEECEVELILPDGIPTSAITRVNVLHESGMQDVEVVDSKVTVPMGRFVDFYLSSDYKFSGFTLNDDPFAEFHGVSSFRVFIDRNSTLSIDLAVYARYESVFSINHAAAVKLTNFINYDNEPEIALVDGDNNISVSEGSPYLRLYDSPAGYIRSITDPDNPDKVYSKGNWQDYYDVTISADGPKKLVIDAVLYSTDPVKVVWDDTYAPGLKFNQLVLAVHNVDYPSVEVEMDETGFTAMPGNSYYLELNTSEYNFTTTYGANNCVYIDNSATEPVPVISYGNPANFQVLEGGTLTLEAAPNPHYIFTITIDDPTAATVYHRVPDGYYYKDIEITGLEAGVTKEFDIVNATYPKIFVAPIDADHYATAREANSDQILGPGAFSVDNGYDVQITTGAYDRSSQMVVYVKDRALADYTFQIRLADEKTYIRDDEYNNIPFWIDGYNFINFDEKGDVPMTFTISGDSYNGTFDSSKVLFILDDEPQVSPTTYLEYKIAPKNGSVIKAFVGGEPDKYDVNFTIEGEKNFTVKKDVLTEVADFSEPVNVHEGTRVDVIPDEGETIEVTVNDRKMPLLEGQYTFYVAAATDVKIQGKQSGIDTIGADAAPADRDVYNLQGIKVLDNATPAQIKALPAGLYIQGGQKIIVK